MGEKFQRKEVSYTREPWEDEPVNESEQDEIPWRATKDAFCNVQGCQGQQYGESGVCFRHLLEEVKKSNPD